MSSTNEPKGAFVSTENRNRNSEKLDIIEAKNPQSEGNIIHINKKILKEAGTNDLESISEMEIKFTKIIAYLSEKGIRMNTFNNKPCLIDGKNLDDRIFNTVYIDATKLIKGVSITDMKSVIKSNYIQDCNPVKDQFMEWSLLESNSELDKFVNCFEIDADENVDFIRSLIVKWIFQFPAMAIDEIPPRLVLVLIGPSHIGKTTLLRKLMPEVLSDYYAESELNRAKDSYILLSEKLFLNLDEFGGLAKMKPELFKFIVSAESFSERVPYGHFNQKLIRRSVLSGTSNDKYIINDNNAKNSRIIPCMLSGINQKLFNSIDKTLLMAEVSRLYLNRGYASISLNEDEVNQLSELSEDFRIVSIEHDMFGRYLCPGDDFHPINDVVDHLELKLNRRLTPRYLGPILKELNIQQERKRIDGKQYRGCKVKLLE